MTTPLSFTTLADLADLTFVNQRGFVDTLRSLHAKGKRPAHEVEMQADKLPGFRATAEVMRVLAETPSLADDVRDAMRSRRAKTGAAA